MPLAAVATCRAFLTVDPKKRTKPSDNNSPYITYYRQLNKTGRGSAPQRTLSRSAVLALHDIDQLPGILVELQFDLVLLIQLKLTGRIESAGSFLLVLTNNDLHP